MESTMFRIACLGAALLALAGFSVSATGSASEAPANDSSQFEAKVLFRNGTSQTGTLQGVGCSQSICSRTVIKGEDGSHRPVTSSIDSLAGIKNSTPDSALFIAKNGTERRLSLLKDFRVLYLRTQSGGTRKLDLESITSVEFIPAHR